ncbi:MAG TPA: HD domain-containing protein [Caldisericia bacterium]|nr:HD domain-containing protein [Caldisericia bacterium]HPF49266.1 HD domain-containing protein [Caldisericia bacterium]HPI84054.1 HD domain-containing protein [Caldisericia bacterium]
MITIRVPSLDNVEVDKSVISLIDTPYFQRLRKIKQLSLTHLVYPGANHTRFEHSLGVFLLASKYKNHLSENELFQSIVKPEHLRALPYAALLHDIGHYPFGHILENWVSDLPEHEKRSEEIVTNLDLSAILHSCDVDPVVVGQLITGDFIGSSDYQSLRLVRDLLDSPVDADKMDYLERDSLHCGVPYGRSYDKERLMGSLIVSPEGRLALSAKGKSSAEYVIFSRYIMLTEVYWHHTVRSAAIMLIRAMQEATKFDGWDAYRSKLVENFGDEDALAGLGELVKDDPDVYELVRGLGNRHLYKRIRTYSPMDPDSIEVFDALSGLEGSSDALRLSSDLTNMLGLSRMKLLVDILPSKPMTQDISVFYSKRGRYRLLSEVSPIASSLTDTWKSLTGVVRIYCHPSVAADAQKRGEEIDEAVIDAAKKIKSNK